MKGDSLKKCRRQQKLTGLVSILVGLVPIFIGEGVEASLLMIPLGLLMLFTKKAVTYEEYYEEE